MEDTLIYNVLTKKSGMTYHAMKEYRCHDAEQKEMKLIRRDCMEFHRTCNLIWDLGCISYEFFRLKLFILKFFPILVKW